MNKKAIAILGAIFILIVGTLGFLIYTKYATKSPQSNQPNSGNNANTTDVTGQNGGNATTTIPGSPNVGVIKLSSDQVVSPVLFYNGTGITYFDQTGALYQSNIDSTGANLQLTNKKKLDIPLKNGIVKVIWPRKGDNFIIQTRDQAGVFGFSFYNSQTGSYTDLPKPVYSLDWMPAGDKIYYVWSNAGGKDTVNLANPDTSGYQKVSDIWDKNAVVSVSPDGNSVLYYPSSSLTDTNPIVLTTPDGKVWKALVKTGYNSGVLWSPDSQRFLFGKKDVASGNYQLWLYDMLSESVKNLGLFTTVDKAVWDQDSQNIFAAVPNSGVPGSGTPTADSFYKLNTSTLDKKTYPTGSTNVDGEDLFLNATSDKLFFRNAQDGGLYYLDLSQ